jgi:hypothetical protein
LRVVIVNDTDGPHFGCQLVMAAYREQLDRVGIELLGTVSRRIKSLEGYPDFVRRADLVIVNGEGSIHHGKRGELIEVAARYPAILLNCVYQANPDRAAFRQFRLVAARESLSASEISNQGVSARVVPDVILTSRTLADFRPSSPTRGLGFSDNVVDPTSGFPALVGPGRAREYLEEMSRYRSLCIGRFHTILAAAVLRIPFSAWASNTHKIRGLMMDMGIEHLYGRTRREAAALVPDSFPASVADYVERGRREVDRLFESLPDLV